MRAPAAALLLLAAATLTSAASEAAGGGPTAPGCRVVVSPLTLASLTPARQAALEPSPTKVPAVVRGLVDMYVYATDGEIEVRERERGGERGRERTSGGWVEPNEPTPLPPPPSSPTSRLRPTCPTAPSWATGP
jgi:hypothetical protein